MANRKPKTVLYRRKREKKTNYAKRLTLLLSRKARLVVRFTNQRVIAQLVSFTTKGDEILVATDSFTLKKLGWNYSCKNAPAAYLTGLALAKKAAEKGVKEAILDTGFKTPLHGGRAYAFLKGCLDGGLEVPHRAEKIFPAEERISGKHIGDYALHLKGSNEQLYKEVFAQYLKNNLAPEAIVETFEKVKQKVQA